MLKLVDQDGAGGTFLGSLLVPEEWERQLEATQGVRFSTRLPTQPPEEPLGIAPRSVAPEGELISAWHPVIGRAVRMVGLDVERFEQLPGCAFIPAQDYALRMLGIPIPCRASPVSAEK